MEELLFKAFAEKKKKQNEVLSLLLAWEII